MKQEFIGWICRCWTEKSGQGWTSSLERFGTEEEAREYGYSHNRLFEEGDLTREFEVYKDYSF